MTNYYRREDRNFRKNHGKSGVVYLLENRAFREGIYKIGQSTKSGESRARNLNEDATTGTPAEFFCVFQHPTKDCGLAEELVHKELDSYRRGKWGQEFFEVPLEDAKAVIIRIVKKVDREFIDADKPEQLGKPNERVEYTQFKSNSTIKRSSAGIFDVIFYSLVGGLLLWIIVAMGNLGDQLKKEGPINLLVILVLIVVFVNLIIWAFRLFNFIHNWLKRTLLPKNIEITPNQRLMDEAVTSADNGLQPLLNSKISKDIEKSPPAKILDEAYTNSASKIHSGYKYWLLNKLKLSEIEEKCKVHPEFSLFISQIGDQDELWSFTAKYVIHVPSYPSTRNYFEDGIAIVSQNSIRSVIVLDIYEYSDY